MTPSSSDGSYTFTQVPTGSDYKICVTALGGDGCRTKWGLQSPIGNPDCAAISSADGPSDRRPICCRTLGTPPHRRSRDFQVVPVVGPFGRAPDTRRWAATPSIRASNSTKLGRVLRAGHLGRLEGSTNFRFSPITDVHAAELSVREDLSPRDAAPPTSPEHLDGQQATLSYDDVAPFLDRRPEADAVLPHRSDRGPAVGPASRRAASCRARETSCIVTGEQTVVAGPARCTSSTRSTPPTTAADRSVG